MDYKNNGMKIKSAHKMKKPIYKKLWFLLVIVIAFLTVYSVQLAYNKENTKQNHSQTNESTVSVQETTEISENDFKNSCEIIDYKTLARNPDKYKGNNYQLTGEVIQVQESSYSNQVDLRINITKETNEYTDILRYTDTIYATVEIPDGEDRILEDDIITFWGTCDGMYTYESVLGSSISLPKINIKYYELNN